MRELKAKSQKKVLGLMELGKAQQEELRQAYKRGKREAAEEPSGKTARQASGDMLEDPNAEDNEE